MENNSYFNYFTEIEEHFQRRRGTILLLSTLDWVLIETWKDAGIPLEAVLRGIDAAFDRYDARPNKTRKVNSLAYCSQEVLAAAEDMSQAAEGANRAEPTETGFEAPSVADYLTRNAAQLESLLSQTVASEPAEQSCHAPARPQPSRPGKTTPAVDLPASVQILVTDSARTLRELALDVAPDSSPVGPDVALGSSPAGPRVRSTPLSLEDLERRLTVMEEKLFGALLAATSEEELVQVRAEADRELAPYRRKMSGPQLDQLQKQYVHKRLLERYAVPRLSLFYM